MKTVWFIIAAVPAMLLATALVMFDWPAWLVAVVGLAVFAVFFVAGCICIVGGEK